MPKGIIDDAASRLGEPPAREEAAKAIEKLRKTAAKLAESEKSEPGVCTLCQVCVRLCRDVIGAAVLELDKPSSDRSTWRIAAAAPERCTGCAACAEVCPTGFIACETGSSRRTVWDLEFEMLRCRHCGQAHITVVQGDFLGGRNGVPRAYFETCDACKRREHGELFARLQVGR